MLRPILVATLVGGTLEILSAFVARRYLAPPMPGRA